jgi:hypothetical protein
VLGLSGWTTQRAPSSLAHTRFFAVSPYQCPAICACLHSSHNNNNNFFCLMHICPVFIPLQTMPLALSAV